MNRFGRTASMILALVIVIGVAGTRAVVFAQTDERSSPATGSPGDVAAGRALYQRAGCWTCHGHGAQGSEHTGPALLGRQFEERAFIAFLRRPPGVMPPYTQRLISDDEARDILAYLRSLQPG